MPVNVQSSVFNFHSQYFLFPAEMTLKVNALFPKGLGPLISAILMQEICCGKSQNILEINKFNCQKRIFLKRTHSSNQKKRNEFEK